MSRPASPDPLAPFPAGAFGADDVDAGRATGLRDRRGRGLRHPRPFGERSPRGRADAFMTAVEKAVERLGDLDAAGLSRVTVRVERIPDRLDERLRELAAGVERDEEAIFARAERTGPDGVDLVLFERPLVESSTPADLERAVYGVALSRCADALGLDPQVLDPSWGRA